MKQKYRLYQRSNGVFYLQDNSDSTNQQSLKTKDEGAAAELLAAANKGNQDTSLSLELGKTYLRAADPKLVSRTWKNVFESYHFKKEVTKQRFERAVNSKAFDTIRNKPLIQTSGEDLLFVIHKNRSANHFLKRLHNHALGNDWIFRNIIPPKNWPKGKPKTLKRAITAKEHQRIIEAESNLERKTYYQMLWEIGAAQTDCANLTNEDNIDLKNGILSYRRKKNGQWARLEIYDDLKKLLNNLPKTGPLFPNIRNLKDFARSAEFYRRCKLLNLKGISLHSYRFSVAERLYEKGYPERFAMAFLGHDSEAIHRYYAKNANVVCPTFKNMTVQSL